MDILTEYSFGQGFRLLDEDEFNVKWRDTNFNIVQFLPIIRHFQWFFRPVEVLPESISRLLVSDLSQMLEYQGVRIFQSPGVEFVTCTGI